MKSRNWTNLFKQINEIEQKYFRKNSRDFSETTTRQSNQINISEFELNINWAISTLFNANAWNMKWIDRNQVNARMTHYKWNDTKLE